MKKRYYWFYPKYIIYCILDTLLFDMELLHLQYIYTRRFKLITIREVAELVPV